MDLIAAILLFLLSLVGLQPKQPTPPPPPPAPLGYNLGLDPSRDGSGIPNGVTAIRASGATRFRDGFSWSWLTDSTPEQPVPASLTRPLTESGNEAVDELDRKYRALDEAGIEPVFVLLYAPAWASSRPQCADRAYETANPVICNRKYHPTQEFLPQYRQVVAALARRYPKATFEGWNEPDHEAITNPVNATTPEKLADEQCALYEAVKSVDGSRTVLSPSMSDYYSRLHRSLPDRARRPPLPRRLLDPSVHGRRRGRRRRRDRPDDQARAGGAGRPGRQEPDLGDRDRLLDLGRLPRRRHPGRRPPTGDRPPPRPAGRASDLRPRPPRRARAVALRRPRSGLRTAADRLVAEARLLRPGRAGQGQLPGLLRAPPPCSRVVGGAAGW